MKTATTLADIWQDLGTDERLSILLEQQTAEVRRLVAAIEADPSISDTVRARVGGYATAIGDVAFYVVEGHPLPPEDFG